MWWVIAGVVVIALGAASWGPIVSRVEQPKYSVVESAGSIEIREYAPMIVAETETAGERSEAINRGFRIIADYIFGNNSAASKLAMTAPVTQQASEKIAMTAPVMQQGAGGSWRVRFVMPSGYTMDTLPRPRNPAVTLRPVPARRVAVIRFTGSTGADNLQRHRTQLEHFVSDRRLKTVAAPTFAFYDPPWTLPFLRRNEVMVEIAD
jgi:hypothetical protein